MGGGRVGDVERVAAEAKSGERHRRFSQGVTVDGAGARSERDALDAVLTPEGVGAHVERMSIEGKLEEEIVGVAERLDVDLIAMPTRGHDSIRDWLLGSKTERVIRRAGCPVIVFEL